MLVWTLRLASAPGLLALVESGAGAGAAALAAGALAVAVAGSRRPLPTA